MLGRYKNLLFKIVAPSILAIALFIMAFFMVIIPNMEENIMNHKKETVKELTYSVYSLLIEYNKEALISGISVNDKKKAAIHRIGNIRYGKDNMNYFWISDTASKFIMHPYSQALVNVHPDSIEDNSVSKLLYEITATVESNNEGFIYYHWQSFYDPQKKVPKLSFVKEYKPWGWIIGTGMYLEGVKAEISDIKIKLIKISFVIILVIILIIAFIVIQSSRMEEKKIRAEEKLIESENKFRTLFETANDALLIIDTEMNIVECNQKTTALHGYNKKEIIGVSPLKFSTTFQSNGRPSADMAKELLTNAFKGLPQSVEWKLKNPDGSILITWITMNLFSFQQKKFVLVSLRDITEMKKIEQKLLTATVKAEEIERTRFAKELHDGIGPIFSTVKLYFQWLAEVEDHSHKKSIIEKGNKNIEEAIMSLKEISYNLSPHILSNYGLVTATENFIKRVTEAGKTQIDLKTNLKGRLVNEVELMLYRVITELINNGIKYSDSQKITLRVIQMKNLGLLRIKYKDNGKGFDVEKAFSSRKSLGLYNIQSRIKTLGGNIEWKSGPGEGLLVDIQIPLNEEYA